MAKIRILVVDDSVVVRRILCDTLAEDPDLEVVGTASNGRVAISKLALLKPDLVTLDIEMPGMNGLETLAALRKTHARLPVIMFSTLTERGASATLEALSLGATDYATKPSNTGSRSEAVEHVRKELVPKIKALLLPAFRHAPSKKVSCIRASSPQAERIEIVAIGTSTGGPNALADILPRIPKDFPVPVVIVQHMPALFTRLLAERLAARSSIPVREGTHGENLRAGEVWLAPGNYHMTLARKSGHARLELHQGPQENSCRPSVDVLFRGVAEIYGAHVLGVVMTGMGADGVQGSWAIRATGGTVIVQDEASSIVWGMPGLVYAAGQADGVYSLSQLAEEITWRVAANRALPAAADRADANALHPPSSR